MLQPASEAQPTKLRQSAGRLVAHCNLLFDWEAAADADIQLIVTVLTCTFQVPRSCRDSHCQSDSLSAWALPGIILTGISESEVYSNEVYNRKYFVNSYNNMLNYDVLITILSKNIVLITF